MTKQLCDSSVIANNARKTQKLFVQGYNLEVYDVIKYTRKHRATVLTDYTYHVQAWLLCDVIRKSRNRLLSPSVRFTPCYRNIEEQVRE